MTLTTGGYKFPRKKTYAAGILVKLLDGNTITNAQMMAELNCPHPATAMSHLRKRCKWEDFIKDKDGPAISGMGDSTHAKKYWLDPLEILKLKASDPRVESFLKTNRKI
ncbi:hypothetical protein M5F00_11060 [Acinetobacter sp. ANC 4945]|uniref:Uncharacterized protein n=1 Tax=Acinetobacter amyesii TaxID=2942470 RepID=A0A1T1GQ22_9GAMM|nr:hypothetical protein [Acinetobacter amyesii]MCL6248400.1 hypothetical protein [Acinetobacter amyesii]OOV79656.1 hypothetical protein B1202_16015 [Acinetobacter amyesii]